MSTVSNDATLETFLNCCRSSEWALYLTRLLIRISLILTVSLSFLDSSMCHRKSGTWKRRKKRSRDKSDRCKNLIFSLSFNKNHAVVFVGISFFLSFSFVSEAESCNVSLISFFQFYGFCSAAARIVGREVIVAVSIDAQKPLITRFRYLRWNVSFVLLNRGPTGRADTQHKRFFSFYFFYFFYFFFFQQWKSAAINRVIIYRISLLTFPDWWLFSPDR